MVNSEQIKVLSDRVDALRKYLDIDAKTMQLQEEELKTQVPDFWLDQKRAEEQMKKVKAIKYWILAFNVVKSAVEELQLSLEFYKEDAMTEAEVDALSQKSITLIEDLELRNMLRKEEDKLGAVIKIVAGAGSNT